MQRCDTNALIAVTVDGVDMYDRGDIHNRGDMYERGEMYDQGNDKGVHLT